MVVVIDNKADLTPTSSPPSDTTSKASDMMDPPPYTPREHANTTSFPTSPNSEFLFKDLRPTNHLDIHQSLSAVGGKWLIDTGLQLPNYAGNYLNQNSKDRPNLSLKTQLGTISASIELAGGPGRAKLVAVSYIGTISVRVSNPMNQSMDLYCQTSTGTISVYLPRNFRGPVTLKSDVGTKSFSEAVEANTAIFSKRAGIVRGFIGEYEGTGYGEDGREWEGDQLYAQSSIGVIDVRYLDEWKNVSGVEK